MNSFGFGNFNNNPFNNYNNQNNPLAEFLKNYIPTNSESQPVQSINAYVQICQLQYNQYLF